MIKFHCRVHLSKRRVRGGAGGVQSAVSQLVVKHRELNENEKKAQVSEEPSKRLSHNHQLVCHRIPATFL